jgi:catechol 2,3-dioxygenase-like lactoylglutathione lyase family enzyme
MFSHVMVGSNDIDRSQLFYDALFGKVAFRDPRDRLVYRQKGSTFMVSKPINGEPAHHANGGTIGFSFDSPQEVDAWHRAGTSNGGASCEDPPGYRDSPFGKLYLAYMRDPDGNKLCGLHRPPAE